MGNLPASRPQPGQQLARRAAASCFWAAAAVAQLRNCARDLPAPLIIAGRLAASRPSALELNYAPGGWAIRWSARGEQLLLASARELSLISRLVAAEPMNNIRPRKSACCATCSTRVQVGKKLATWTRVRAARRD